MESGLLGLLTVWIGGDEVKDAEEQDKNEKRKE